MKKLILLLFIAFTGILMMTSCLKAKDFTCECTYVPNGGGANKVETEVIQARFLEDAKFDCNLLESKYVMQGSIGTCIIK